MADKLKVAVVTGGHSYDVMNFHRLFASIEGIEPFVQHGRFRVERRRDTRRI